MVLLAESVSLLVAFITGGPVMRLGKLMDSIVPSHYLA
jgi:hypothetical protein